MSIYLTNEDIRHLGGLHTLSLSMSKITCVKHLGNLHTLNLSGCHKIPDNEFKYLGNVHTLNLNGCIKLTDESVKHLGEVRILNLNGCNKITEFGLGFLGNCEKLYLGVSNFSQQYLERNTNIWMNLNVKMELNRDSWVKYNTELYNKLYRTSSISMPEYSPISMPEYSLEIEYIV
jgi:hypothetical protein